MFAISKLVSSLCHKGDVWIAGDFNGRSGTFQSSTLIEEGSLNWRECEEAEWVRASEDEGRNGLSDSFENFVLACGLTILNETCKFPDTQAFTFTSEAGSSVIDYVLASRSARERVIDFSFSPFYPESDHRAICFVLEWAGARLKKQHGQRGRGIYLDQSKRGAYERHLRSCLRDDILPCDMSHVIIRSARVVFSQRRPTSKHWFDEECRHERTRVMGLPIEERQEAFRLFWRRLQPPSVVPELPEFELMQYVAQLYHFPDAKPMPTAAYPLCIFSENEVKQELSHLKLGKAADLMGITAELVCWGGDTLSLVVTRLINRACAEGIPEEWTWRKVVPLHKSGSKQDPRNYRTIMVASLFAKLLGRLLERRLNCWCEDLHVRAPAQAGFRSGFSTLDHVLVLRVLMENARKMKQSLYVLFVDFSKAFDSVPRFLIWERLNRVGVPQDIINSVAALYANVVVKKSVQGKGVASTLGVIQGCPLSPTLFGLLIDDLLWSSVEEVKGVPLGTTTVSMLLFADDVALVATSMEQLQLISLG
ncbi:hypothetical protein R1sor_008966 [Riccia sorocarpa]|uniref:Reverse transcriptase domain-containing protein n=1 Tax=Riccia sorocarpa TaxID=122646 RepID=A0ABD3H779_9MARC